MLKFERTLEFCGEGPFERALELGCSEGAFTRLLAPRCRSLVAVDISEIAVERARERLRGLDHVTCEVLQLPSEFPEGEFDLIVASDVLYYWPLADVVATLPRIEDALAPGGVLLALHYIPRMGALINGHEVHDALLEHATLAHAHAETTEFGSGRRYRIDRFVKPAASR
jgi:predicted TPR repeat methyltransferase